MVFSFPLLVTCLITNCIGSLHRKPQGGRLMEEVFYSQKIDIPERTYFLPSLIMFEPNVGGGCPSVCCEDVFG